MPIIRRNLADSFRRQLRHYPVVMVTGPRQCGKTTLCRTLLSDRPYVSLEGLDLRAYVQDDPVGFLREYRQGAVIEEVQWAPELVAYLHDIVDEDPAPGRFVLTASQHVGLSPVMRQWLAGRVGVLHLLPPGFDELARFGGPAPSLLDALWTGAYPSIHHRGIPPDIWLRDHLVTCMERDVRGMWNIVKLEAFLAFVKSAAGRTGMEVNLSALAADVGIRHNTARAWLAILEAHFLIFRIPAYDRNLRTRQIKAPKLHFLDSGFVCHLLGIRSPEELRHHPLRGQIFESWVAAEVFKAITHRGGTPRLRHYRAAGTRVDLIVDRGTRLILAEAKSAGTVAPHFCSGMRTLGEALAKAGLAVDRRLIYGGDLLRQHNLADVLPWNRMLELTWN